MTFLHTIGLPRYQGFQEKYERLMKVMKAIPKAKETTIILAFLLARL